MKGAALIAFFAAVCFSQDAPKPVCNASIRGQFWPAEANSSAEAARRLTQSGDLEMCSQGLWRYKWEHLSVSVHDLAKSKQTAAAQPKPSGDSQSK